MRTIYSPIFIGVGTHYHTLPPKPAQVLSMEAPRAAVLTTRLLAL